MKELIASLANQIREAIEIGEKTNFVHPKKEFSSILVCGLGGSGIGGKIVSLLLKDDLKIPFLCINDYDVPAWVNKSTLVIGSSYSGNTEETLAAIHVCMERGAEIAIISSGGSISDLAKENNWNLFEVPSGEQPRAMLAYSIVQQLYILQKYDLISMQHLNELKQVPSFIEETEQDTRDEAMKIASEFSGKRPIIYAGSDFEGVAVRWRQQINENAKELTWHHVFPEMTHNELVGWAGGSTNESPIFLNSTYNHPRTNRRWEISKEVISKYTHSIQETTAKGDTKLAHNFYLIHLGDWVSYFMSEIKKIDAVEVNIIGHLKSEMAKMK